MERACRQNEPPAPENETISESSPDPTALAVDAIEHGSSAEHLRGIALTLVLFALAMRLVLWLIYRPIALRDDLSHAADLLETGTEAELDYVTQFLSGVARSADDDALDAVIERFGGVDILVTNCGGPPPGLFDDVETLTGWFDRSYDWIGTLDPK